MRVKICGITNLQDALHAVSAGADALGFVFYKKSPRYIDPNEAGKIIAKLPPFVEKVGLFVEESAEKIDTISRLARIGLAQIHFDVDEAFLDSIEIRTLPVIRAHSKEEIGRLGERYRLVDAYTEAYGGSGQRLNLDWFEGMDCSKVILAGGLTPENIYSVKKYGFYGVDVSSGTEASKGIKDPQKVEQFIKHAKSV